MRWILWLLLAANIAYLLFNIVFSVFTSEEVDQSNEGVAGKKYDVPTVILLSEQASVGRALEEENRAETSQLLELKPASSAESNSGTIKRKVKSVLVCREVGPFLDERKAKTIADNIKDEVKLVLVKREKAAEEKTYWLTIDNADDPIDAINEKLKTIDLVAEQRQVGEKNEYAIGPFLNLPTAESFYFRLAAIDIYVKIEPVLEITYHYWIQLEWQVDVGFKSPTELINELFEHNGLTDKLIYDGKLQQIDCL